MAWLEAWRWQNISDGFFYKKLFDTIERKWYFGIAVSILIAKMELLFP